MDRVGRAQDVAVDGLVGDPAGEHQVVADLARREVGTDRLTGDLQQGRQLLEQAGRAELCPERDEDLLLTCGAREIAVADALSRSNVGEGVPPVQMMDAGRQGKAGRFRRTSRSAGR